MAISAYFTPKNCRFIYKNCTQSTRKHNDETWLKSCFMALVNPNPHGLFLNDFTQSDISALNGPIFKIFFLPERFFKILAKNC